MMELLQGWPALVSKMFALNMSGIPSKKHTWKRAQYCISLFM